ncbi:MAG: IS701 family transposase [Deltaproteobacteria bacterium]|nr:IS701 family transposase [Deltaproteobacteria bacterium]
MTIFRVHCGLVNKFLGRFSSLFSRRQSLYFSLYVCMLFRDMKRANLEVMAKTTSCEYENLQYFFSDSKWDHEKLNDERIALIERQRTTGSTADGVLAIDDSSCPKIYAKKTEGAGYQHCGALGREAVCNVFVSSAFVSKSKSFPINFKFYKKEEEFDEKTFHNFRSKIQLAQELVDDAVAKEIRFSAVVFDSWYAHSSDLIESLHSKDLTLIGEVKANRNILVYHPVKRKRCFMQQDELVTLVKKHYWHKIKPVRLKTQDGKTKTVMTYQFKGKLKDCHVPLKIVILFGPYGKKDQKKVHILITNNSRLSAQKIVDLYRLRWGIETCYRELKDFFMMDHYQVRNRQRIERHWALCHIAWTLAYWVKQNGYLRKILSYNPESLNDVRHAINDIIGFHQTVTAAKNPAQLAKKLKIKSARIHNKAG